jgi:hypothetical protein
MTENNGFDNTLYNEGTKETLEEKTNVGQSNVPPINLEADKQEANNMKKTIKNIGNYFKNNRPVDAKTKNDEYTNRTAEAMGYKAEGLKKLIVDTLQEYGVYDVRSNYTKKELDKLEKNYNALLKDVAGHQTELEGRVLYTPMTKGSEEEFRQKLSVPESSKGLEYRMNEYLDLSQIAINKYKNCELKRDQYSQRINTLTIEIDKEKQNTPSDMSLQKINALSKERNALVTQKNVYQGLMADASQEVYANDELYKAHSNMVNEKRLFLLKSKSALTKLGITVEIMRTYVATNTGSKSLDQTLDGLEKAMDKGAKAVDAIAIYQEKMGYRMGRISAINGGMGQNIVNNEYFANQEQELNHEYTQSFAAVDRIAKERGM